MSVIWSDSYALSNDVFVLNVNNLSPVFTSLCFEQLPQIEKSEIDLGRPSPGKRWRLGQSSRNYVVGEKRLERPLQSIFLDLDNQRYSNV
ncbi:unnamed protein product [Sphenostylis stenocarpa]|uniref:Uncharacterized protein n=1 Tax=Sphenostylis stenocarpa TaxID=92480 RepID=A0AA86W3R8_9FABA|nr:unnamed protein product [Sphenostylis stenocarpa]